ncbi:MAG: hypothetical protein QOJ35_2238 [Solirubrobacteraceae bacterium]|nr:hypothetical protein [Solirubrobacteraceae bacterium]
MVRSLVDEVVRRRLWPIPVVALLIAIAAPLLFMKSAPPAEPASTLAPPPAAAGKLPATAQQLLTTSDAAVEAHKRSTRKRQDPFQAPASAAKPASAAAAAAGGVVKASQQTAIPVVITSSNGSTSTGTASPGTAKSSTPATTTKKTTTTKSKAKPATTPKRTVPATTSVAATEKPGVAVDVRFAERKGSILRLRVPRLQTFQAGGMVAAMFVGYSQARNAAVFAVAPSTLVRGITCRKVHGVCRYVDIPAGSYARLTLRGRDGSIVSRRLDVARIRHLPRAGTTHAAMRRTSLSAATCLLKRLLKLPAIAPSISTDACA